MWMCVIVAFAQTLTANAPSKVMTGENFRLTYTVNTQNASDFRMGKVPDALEIITGPYTSQQSSFQMVNGHTSSSSSITYTFIICANKNGTYTIPPAHVSAGGKDVQSQPVKITVSGTAQSTNGAPRMHDDHDDQPQLRSAGSHITGNDLFIKVSASKSRVHEQEPVLLTYKVYTLVELTYLEGNMPDLTGFHTQEIPLPQQKSYHVETVNGRPYRCVTWKQYVMYPQVTGKLEIPSITFDGTVIQQNRDVDPFEAFFNGGSGYVEVKRSIKAPGLKLQVDPLPTRPSNFSGGVGRFNISAQINKKEVKANDPITIRVVVGGTGNLKLIKQPVIDFPKDFDKYDPKVTDKTKLTVNGVEGNMIYDFLAVPRNQGKYTIPAIEFVYFDANANAYKTLKTTPFELNVLKGDGNSGSSDRAKILGAGYEVYIMAFFIGLYANKKLPLTTDSSKRKILGQPIMYWGNQENRKDRKSYNKIVDYIFVSLVARTEINFMDLEKGTITARSVIDQLIDTMEQYANYGFAYMLEKLDEAPGYFYNNEAFLAIFTSFIPQNEEETKTWSSDDLPDELSTENGESSVKEDKGSILNVDDEADEL